MNRVVRGPAELKIGSSILTRRGGTDANTPESTRKAILRDWHFGPLVGSPTFGKSWEMDPQIFVFYNMDLYESRIGPNEQLIHFPS